MYIYNIRNNCRCLLSLGAWLLAASAMPSSAWAECLDTPNSEFTLLVDASSSCAALSSNMSGCQTGSNGLCTITRSGFEPIVIQVTPSNAVGSVPADPGRVSWQVLNGPPLLAGKEVDVVISVAMEQPCNTTHFV